MPTKHRFWLDGGRKGASQRAQFQRDSFSLVMVPVGPGEAIFLEAGKTAALVDGGAGGENENKSVATGLQSWVEARDLRLKLLIASHPHRDHLNALPLLLRALPKSRLAPNAAFVHNGQVVSKFSKKLLKQVEDLKHLRVVVPTTPRTVQLGPRTRLRLFMDGTTSHGAAYQSVMTLVEHGGARFLLTGDVYQDYEKKLVNSNQLRAWLPAQVLKVTHHGSKGGTGETFLNAVNPLLALASTALEPDGSFDPHHNIDTPTANRLQKKNVKVFQTATDGRIIITTDGVRQPEGILFEVATNA